ncbi:protease associated domain containing protein 1 [Plakobranchus ocellatus]|uniref:Protease associated domain containing protein 1 n=1 Tax=Plakobranchus ocellatus TaxID=259542 RepID=A0AAV4CX98_9GAST|nr:protease associated domain containing protein 1 [Plakobranchus ocellatus]
MYFYLASLKKTPVKVKMKVKVHDIPNRIVSLPKIVGPHARSQRTDLSMAHLHQTWKHLTKSVEVFVSLCLITSFSSCYALEVATIPNRQNVFEDTMYFEIFWPETLQYTYKLNLAQDFGSAFDRVYSKVELILADPEEACQDLYNEVKGAVALILRGGCSFLTKTKKAEEAGAIATIIADNEKVNNDKMVEMVDDNTDRTVNIPSAFLSGKDGEMIRHYLNAARTDRAIINIPVNLTGKPLSATRRPPWAVW